MTKKSPKNSKRKSNRDQGYFDRTNLENLKRTDLYLDSVGFGSPPHEQQIEAQHDRKFNQRRHNKPKKS